MDKNKMDMDKYMENKKKGCVVSKMADDFAKPLDKLKKAYDR